MQQLEIPRKRQKAKISPSYYNPQIQYRLNESQSKPQPQSQIPEKEHDFFSYQNFIELKQSGSFQQIETNLHTIEAVRGEQISVETPMIEWLDLHIHQLQERIKTIQATSKAIIDMHAALPGLYTLHWPLDATRYESIRVMLERAQCSGTEHQQKLRALQVQLKTLSMLVYQMDLAESSLIMSYSCVHNQLVVNDQ